MAALAVVKVQGISDLASARTYFLSLVEAAVPLAQTGPAKRVLLTHIVRKRLQQVGSGFVLLPIDGGCAGTVLVAAAAASNKVLASYNKTKRFSKLVEELETVGLVVRVGAELVLQPERLAALAGNKRIELQEILFHLGTGDPPGLTSLSEANVKCAHLLNKMLDGQSVNYVRTAALISLQLSGLQQRASLPWAQCFVPMDDLELDFQHHVDQHANRAKLQAEYASYHHSLAVVFSSNDCRGLVKVAQVAGRQQAIFRIDLLLRLQDAAPAIKIRAAWKDGMVQQGRGPLGGSTGSNAAASSSSSYGAAPSQAAGSAFQAGPAAVTVVAGLQQAHEAVEWLLAQPVLALDSEGCDLGRTGRVCLVQLHAPGRTYLFDLLAGQPADQADMLEELRRVLEEPSVVKVIHDCRRDSEALFYQHKMRLAGLWDTQVAYALGQLLGCLANAPTELGRGANVIGMNALLERYGLPPNPHKSAVGRWMGHDQGLWAARPLDEKLLEYAAADVAHLLELREALQSDLGSSGDAVVAHLSKAYGEWYFDAGDRAFASGAPGSYATAARLPLGVDAELRIEAPDYRPSFTLALEPHGEDNTPEPQAAGPGEAAQGDDSDPEAEEVLALLHPELRAAILQLCWQPAPQEQQAAGEVEGSSRQGNWFSRLKDKLGKHGKHPAAGGSAEAGRPRYRMPIEVVADVGRPVSVRFADGGEEELSMKIDMQDALERLEFAKLGGASDSLGGLFRKDNRAGLPGTLHRISALRGLGGEVLGLTYRIGRHVPGVGRRVLDLLAGLSVQHPASSLPSDAGAPSDRAASDFATPSLLLLGPPGVGKTTLLRDVANHLADTFRQRVMVVDTSNEIAGDGTKPHDCIGRARRIMVPSRDQQHSVLLETVQNHNPQCVIVDEIGSSKEVAAVKSISQRGVSLVGTAHGICLEGLLRDPDLNLLVGGLQQVTLGDVEAKASNSGVKTRTERRGAPCFSTLIEVLSYSHLRVHPNVARSVDAVLAGKQPVSQLRWVAPDGRMMVRCEGGQEDASGDGGWAAAATAALKERQGHAWLHDLIQLAALY